MALYPTFFKHDQIRNFVSTFGYIFNKIEVVRYKNNAEDHRVLVPITYGPKEKFYVRSVQDPTLESPQAIQLPRMAFEVLSYSYAPERKQQNSVKLKYVTSDPDSSVYLYQPVPYDLDFGLYAITKSADEMAQIIEQIVPFFTPDYTEAVKMVPEANIITDLPISLKSVNVKDTYEGNFKERREIIMEMHFVMKAWFYGPTRSSKIIKDVNVNVIDVHNVADYPQLPDDFGFRSFE